jgi:hypothetical protein
LKQAGLSLTQGQAPVGQKHQHVEMVDLLMLLEQAKGFRAEAAVEVPIGVHLHLQKHHRHRFAATGMIAGPEHAIRVVRHLLECNGPKDVGRFALAWGRG